MATWNDLSNPQADLAVVRQEFVPIGKTITLRPPDMNDENRYYFLTKAGKGNFITAIIEINGTDKAEAGIEALQRMKIGSYERTFGYNKDIYAVICRRYALNDIPQTDEPLLWCVRLGTDNNAPESVTIRFEKT